MWPVCDRTQYCWKTRDIFCTTIVDHDFTTVSKVLQNIIARSYVDSKTLSVEMWRYHILIIGQNTKNTNGTLKLRVKDVRKLLNRITLPPINSAFQLIFRYKLFLIGEESLHVWLLQMFERVEDKICVSHSDYSGCL